MKIAVCDNDRTAVKQLVGMIKGMDIVSACKVYYDIHEIVEAVKQGADYDIVVMNIGGAGFDGIRAAKKISELDADTRIIYMSRYTEKYVQEIFLTPTNLSGFLVKPVDEKMLKKNLQKVMKSRKETENRKLEIKYKNEVNSVFYEEIYYLESMGHMVVVHTKKGDFRSYGRLEKVKESLPDTFVHCHKSYVVNMGCIQKIEKNKIILMDGSVVPISKSRYGETRDQYSLYMEELLMMLRNGEGKKEGKKGKEEPQ